MQKVISKFLKYWPIILLVVLTFIVRIIKLEELFYFTYDESIPAFVGRRLILWQHIPLIGGVTPFNFHLAPYFYWLLALILYIGGLNPIVWGLAGAVIAMVTTTMIYISGSAFFSKKVGIIAASFWTFSYLANVYDRHLWALYWGPLISLIVLFSLYKIIKGQKKFIYTLAITIAFAIHADPSNLVFLFLSVVVWFLYKLPIQKTTFIGIGLVILSFLPLLIFDLRHNFSNTRPIADFWQQGRNNPGFEINKFATNSLIFPQALTRLFYTFGDNEISKQYSYCGSFIKEKYQAIPSYLVIISSIILLTFVALGLAKKNKNIGWHLMSILLIIYIAGIQLYGTFFKADIFEHYITGVFALFLLILALIISKLPKKLQLIFLILFIIINLSKLLVAKNSIGLTNKRQAIEFTMQQVGDNDFSIDSLSTCWKLSGYRYLFTVFGKEPIKSYVDSNFGYLYGTTPIANNHPKEIISFVIHDFIPESKEFYKRYANLKSHEINSNIFGNIEVIVIDNTNNWFE